MVPCLQGLNNDLIPDIFHTGPDFYTLTYANAFPTLQVHVPACYGLLSS